MLTTVKGFGEVLMSLYDALLVDQNATLEEIKLAFKRRALQVHPDKGGSKEEFHLVYQALETLGDPTARQKYDQNLALAASITGPAPHAPHSKSRKRKREEKHAQQATSYKAKPQAKQKMPRTKSTTSAGKAPSSSKPRAAARAMPAEPQSKQTKLLMKIRDLLKGLPREVRKDVITNQLSQKQRVLLEKFIVDNVDTSEVFPALAPPGKTAPHRAGRSETCLVVKPPATNSTEANPGRRFAHSMDKVRHPTKRTGTAHDAICNEPGHAATSSTLQASAAQSLTSETSEISKAAMDETPGEGSYALAVPASNVAARQT